MFCAEKKSYSAQILLQRVPVLKYNIKTVFFQKILKKHNQF